nr:MAG TPA: hypothetical protein [Caudoviricetes sp.]
MAIFIFSYRFVNVFVEARIFGSFSGILGQRSDGFDIRPVACSTGADVKGIHRFDSSGVWPHRTRRKERLG